MKLPRSFLGSRLMKPAGDDDSGGGGGGGEGKKDSSPDSAKEMSDLKTSYATLLARFEKLEGKKSGDDGKDKDDEKKSLIDKAREQNESDEKTQAGTKAIEAALKFNLSTPDFIKNNESLLPKDVAGIFKAAETEKYANAIEKATALKSSLIQSFFKVQDNLDLLTGSQKASLEDYLKLTKNGKEERASEIYDSIFEPSFEMLRRLKKAEAVNKGHGVSSTDEDAYKNKLMAGSKKHFLGEKPNA